MSVSKAPEKAVRFETSARSSDSESHTSTPLPNRLAFINSALVLTHGNPAVQGAAAGYGTEATTRSVRQFDLKNFPIGLVDTWGLNNDNLASFPIETLIDGNYDTLEMDGNHRLTHKAAGKGLRFRKAHAILFFLEYEMVNEQNIEGFFKDAWRKISIAAEQKCSLALSLSLFGC